MDQNLTGPRSDRTLLEENWKDSTKYSLKFHHPVCGSMLIEIYFSNFFFTSGLQSMITFMLKKKFALHRIGTSIKRNIPC